MSYFFAVFGIFSLIFILSFLDSGAVMELDEYDMRANSFWLPGYFLVRLAVVFLISLYLYNNFLLVAI